jgi:hypothetical protein
MFHNIEGADKRELDPEWKFAGGGSHQDCVTLLLCLKQIFKG